MRLGLISDIHANAPALQAVLGALDDLGVERTLALGDLVGYHAQVHETLALLRERGIVSVAGNHDQMVLGRLPGARCGPRARRSLAWTQQRLTPVEIDQLAHLPDTLRPAPHFLCVHATVDDPTRRLQGDAEVDAEATRLVLQEPEVRVCAMGHDHQAYVHRVAPDLERVEDRDVEIPLPRRGFAFVNPGSVGEPRGDETEATFAVFDSRRWSVTLHHVPYDHDEVTIADRRAHLLAEMAPGPRFGERLRSIFQLRR